MKKFCENCGKSLPSDANYCPNCGTKVNQDHSNVIPKSRVAAGVLGIFLGMFGVHNFYLGYNGKAIAQLLITLLSCGLFFWVSAIWGLIEGILILTNDINKDADGNNLV